MTLAARADAIAGRLCLSPGTPAPVLIDRPLVGATLLARLTAQRRAALVPDLIGAAFTLCAEVQRATARRAVRAALGQASVPAEQHAEARWVALHTVRDHLQRLALDLPLLLGRAPTASTIACLHDAPVMALRGSTGPHAEAAAAAAAAALPGWVARRLFGMPAADWLMHWAADNGAWLEAWCRRQTNPVTELLRSVHDDAQAVAWPARPLDLLRDGADGLEALGAAMAADPGFAAAARWRGEPAETGPWTRLGHEDRVLTLWSRLGSRLADIARLASGLAPAVGALPLPGHGAIAWSEMSRGLLVHALWLETEGTASLDPALARVATYRVLAPTDWNFHPEGGLARCLREQRLSPAQVRLAAAVMDPCLPFTVETGAHEAPSGGAGDA